MLKKYMEMAGIKRKRTTQIYIHIAAGKQAEILRELHPRNRMLWEWHKICEMYRAISSVFGKLLNLSPPRKYNVLGKIFRSAG